MFHFLFFLPHAEQYAVLRLFKYLTFRSGGAVLTALFVAFVMGPPLIRWLKVKQGKGQPIRSDGPQRHIIEKQGTPTMGGLLILIPVLAATLLWADLSNPYVWIVILVTVSYGLLGFADDYLKVTKRSSAGISGRLRLLIEFGVAFLATWLIMQVEEPSLKGVLAVPFFKSVLLPLGFAFILVGGFVIAGAANAVNFTDGLDGLAIMPAAMVAGALGIFAYASGNSIFANYLSIPAIPQAGELLVFCGALGGAGLGFLWFNSYPAQVFMGDIGALALGAALGVVAIIVRQEIVTLVMGGIFVLETASVILQVASFKLTGRRIFRMAPIHHHFELKGWAEPKVIVRFWIISFLLVLAGLSTLKLR